MRFSYSETWADLVALLRAHGSLIATIAGVFLFLPGLLVAYALPPPEPTDPARVWVEIAHYLTRNWPWLLLNNLVAMVGGAAILLLIFKRGVTVGGALAAAFALLPFYFLASLLGGIIITLGFILLVVPGLYLFGRLAPVTAVVVAENRRNPIDAIRRCFALTKGKGWAVLGLILVVGIAAFVVIAVATWLIGILLVLVAGQDLAAMLVLIVKAAGQAASATLMIVLVAAIYRRLAPRSDLAATFE